VHFVLHRELQVKFRLEVDCIYTKSWWRGGLHFVLHRELQVNFELEVDFIYTKSWWRGGVHFLLHRELQVKFRPEVDCIYTKSWWRGGVHFLLHRELEVNFELEVDCIYPKSWWRGGVHFLFYRESCKFRRGCASVCWARWLCFRVFQVAVLFLLDRSWRSADGLFDGRSRERVELQFLGRASLESTQAAENASARSVA